MKKTPNTDAVPQGEPAPPEPLGIIREIYDPMNENTWHLKPPDEPQPVDANGDPIPTLGRLPPGTTPVEDSHGEGDRTDDGDDKTEASGS